MGWAPNWVGVSDGVAAPVTSISSIARYPQHLDLFCVGGGNRIYGSWWDISTGWANWYPVAGGVAAPGTTISVVARNPDHLDLFVVGSDYRVYGIWWDANGGWAPDGWNPVRNLTAAYGTSVTAIARKPDHLDLFAVDANTKICWIRWDEQGGWDEKWRNPPRGFAAPRYVNHGFDPQSRPHRRLCRRDSG